MFKPAEGEDIDYVNIPGDGRHLSGLGKHRNKGHHYDYDDEEEEPEQTCKIPKLSFFKNSHKDVYHRMEPLTCPGEALFYVKDFTVRINQTVLNGKSIQKCIYRAIAWFNDTHHIYSKPLTRTSNYDLKIKHDFFRVQCFVNGIRGGRHLLNDQKELVKKKIHQIHEGPRMIGSMGMPDPVIPKYPKKSPPLSRSNRNSKEKEVVDINKEEMAIDNARKSKEKETEYIEVLDEVDKSIETSNEDELKDDSQENNEKTKTDKKDQVLESLDQVPDFDQFIVQVYPKKEVDDRNKDDPDFPESLNMNVLLLVVESMSHVCFSRKMPKTQHFLTKTLRGKIMNGYSIVGDCSSGSLFPLLTGNMDTFSLCSV